MKCKCGAPLHREKMTCGNCDYEGKQLPCAEITVIGAIPVKKNKQRISKYGGIYKDPAARAYEELVGWEARVQKLPKITGAFELSGTFYIKRAKDLDGVVTMLLDALQYAEVIENDKYCIRFKDIVKIPVEHATEEKVEVCVSAV